MGNVISADDTLFRWEYTDQPHAQRRIEILRKHPEIKQYMKANGDRSIIIITILLIILHIFLACVMGYIPHSHPYLKTLLAVFVGSFIASYLMMTLHEAAHGLVFGSCHPRLNRWYGVIVNCVLIVPFFTYFKRHHRKHHKYMGHDEMDGEYPSPLEAKLFSVHWSTKYFFMVYNPIFQHIRTPFIGNGERDWLTFEELVNTISCLLINYLLFKFGFEYQWAYLGLSTFVALGTNMFGIWAMTVHCLYFQKEDTICYYGWMNLFFLNFGYHVEHHDFPNIPARFLPQVRKIASEYYEDQWQMDSVYSAILQWIHDPRLGLYSRLKRDHPIDLIQNSVK